MFDGSNLSLQENLDISAKLLERFAKNDLVLEIETGAVGGEEDDVVGDHAAKLYTTPEDTLEVARRLNSIGGRYLLAATFENVHGVYKPGHVKLRDFTSCFTAAQARRRRRSTRRSITAWRK